jgi:hypothetical protein
VGTPLLAEAQRDLTRGDLPQPATGDQHPACSQVSVLARRWRGTSEADPTYIKGICEDNARSITAPQPR